MSPTHTADVVEKAALKDVSEKDLELLLQNRTATMMIVLLLCIALRGAVALHPYSGEGLPPMYGDYEAQRHWMELTLNIPISDWYKNTTDNDLSYWGLDYPPLSAYASYVFGRFMHAFEPAAVQLHTSRGYETPSSRLVMRSTVLFADIILLFPAIVIVVRLLYPNATLSQVRALSFVLTSPSLVLIDHAHFQYNNFTLALFLFSVYALLTHNDAIAAALYCAAIFFKQTTVYYTLAIFAWFLGRTLSLWRLAQKQAAILTLKVFTSIVIITITTFSPWLTSATQFKMVLLRLIPLSRGLYEDKVANVWCTLSPILKVQQLFTGPQLFALCASMTLLASLPFCVALVIKPTSRRLLLSCSGCALSGYLFSYQVHEKQILLPLLPLLVLHPNLPCISTYMSLVTVSSLFPLLWRERSYIAYFAVIMIHLSTALILAPSESAILKHKQNSSDKHSERFIHMNRWFQKGRFSTMVMLSVVICAILHFALATMTPPPRWPFLFELANTSYAFFHLCIIYFLLTIYIFTSD